MKLINADALIEKAKSEAEGMTEQYRDFGVLVEWLVDKLPSAQPVDKDINVPCNDTISRQAAIDVTWEEPSYTDPLNVLTEVRDKIKALPCVYPDYKTDHGYMWLCPKCALVVHSDFVKCPRCGLIRHDTQQEIGITRCKYCKNWIPGYITDNDEFVPPKCGKYQQMVGHSHNDFCSFAERRTE